MAVDAYGSATPSALRGQGIGIIVAAFFGALWAAWAHAWLLRYPPIVPVIAYVITAAASIALLAAGLATIRHARQRSGESDAPATVRRRFGRQYWIVVIAEVVVLNIAAATLFRYGLDAYLAPAFAIIVGLHFFPLAHTFRAPHCYATATLMTVAGTIAVLAIAAGEPAVTAAGLADFACALVLWGTAFISWRRTRHAAGIARFHVIAGAASK